MKSRICFAVGLLVAGCAGQAARPPDNEATRIPESGDWFCQLSESGAGWSCVQDPALAEDPVPERLPQPESPAEPPSAPTEPPSPPEPSPLEPSPLERSPAGGSPAETPPVEAPLLVSPDPVPPSPGTALMEMPGSHYAIQLIAMKTSEELDEFVRRHGLDGTLATRVERQGELYYVLLLGVYEVLREAEDAKAGLPTALRDAEPWIRPLSSLQAAMGRAEAAKPSA